MKRLLDCLRGARRLELFFLMAILAAALLVLMRPDGGYSRRAAGDDRERRLQTLLERIDGIEEVSVMISDDGQGNANGAVVVCGYLRDAAAYLEAQAAVRAILNVELTQIEIIANRGFS